MVVEMSGPDVTALWRLEGFPDHLDVSRMFEEPEAEEEEEVALDTDSAHTTFDLPLNASKLLFDRAQSSYKARSRSPSPRSGASSRSSSPGARRLSAIGMGIGMDSPISSAVNPVGKHGLRTCAVWAVALAAFTTAAMKAPKLSRSVEVDCSSLLRESHNTASLTSLLRPQCGMTGEPHLMGEATRMTTEDSGCDDIDDLDLRTVCLRLRGGINDNSDVARLRGGMEDVCQGCAKAGFEGRRGFEMLRESASRDKPVRPKLSRTVDLH